MPALLLLRPPPPADGVRAATDLQRFSQPQMEQLFGLKPAAAAQLVQWCRGIDTTPVQVGWGAAGPSQLWASCACCCRCCTHWLLHAPLAPIVPQLRELGCWDFMAPRAPACCGGGAA